MNKFYRIALTLLLLPGLQAAAAGRVSGKTNFPISILCGILGFTYTGLKAVYNNNCATTQLFAATTEEQVQEALDLGADINAVRRYKTALLEAAHKGNIPLIRTLARKGANLEFEGIGPITPVQAANIYNCSSQISGHSNSSRAS